MARRHVSSSNFRYERVYVTGFTDDRSRFRVVSGAYLHKSRKESIDALHKAVRKGRVPREAYFGNGKQFIAKEFKAELARYNIRPIYGKPYNPRRRGKIESYHKVLYRELVSRVRFTSLAHFKRELRKFDRRYNYWRRTRHLAGRLMHPYTTTEDISTRREQNHDPKVTLSLAHYT